MVTVVKKDKFSLISWFEQFKKNGSGESLRRPTVKNGVRMIEDKVVGYIRQSSCSSNLAF
jgi:hypothetical protein